MRPVPRLTSPFALLPSIACIFFCNLAAAQPPAKTQTENVAVDAAAIIEATRAASIEKWEDDIKKLEDLDTQQVDPSDGILFVGSSSIRRWDSITGDMKPWNAIRRGYGGAKFTDLAVFIDRIIANHDYQALVIFVGNDISGRETDRTPEEVQALFKYVTDRALVAKPGKPVFYIEITPTSSRFQAWDAISAGNQMIKQYCKSEPLLHYIDTAKQYLTPGGRPNDSLFVNDKLHLNEKGYQLWAKIIKKHLTRGLEKQTPQAPKN